MSTITARLQMLRRDALARQRGRCLYCKDKITDKCATAEHKHPRSRGGLTSRANIGAACQPCNLAKGDMRQGQFYRLIDRGFPRGASIEIQLIWAKRHIAKRTFIACRRIERASA